MIVDWLIESYFDFIAKLMTDIAVTCLPVLVILGIVLSIYIGRKEG